MKAASVNEIKQQLKNTSPQQLMELCLHLARYKNDNKEYLTYLLFEADDEQAYIRSVKDEIDELFNEINTSNLYYAKKTLRKILRRCTKYIRHTESKMAEAEILIHYLTKIKALHIQLHKSATLINLYTAQLKKISAALSNLHEDLQQDYQQTLKDLEL